MKRKPTIVIAVPEETWEDRPVLLILGGIVGALMFFALGWLGAMIGMVLGLMR